MDLEYIKQRVADIEAVQGDDESAHAMEDDLHLAFIKLVAQVGPPELAAMASEVLKTDELPFARWCA